MKVVILAGGRGTRMGEETSNIPKPMIRIGGKPLLWHIMKYFYSFGHDEFIILCGYKREIILEFFMNYPYTIAERVLCEPGKVRGHSYVTEKWHVDLVNTGEDTLTADRLMQVRDLLTEDFWLTYGDGLGTIDLNVAYEWWKADDAVAQVTAVHPPSRFGQLEIMGDRVTNFQEKPLESGWINGGFFVVSPEIFHHIRPVTMLEFDTFPTLAKEGGLGVYHHEGWWACVDTPRDKDYLNELYNRGGAPWKVW